MHSVVKFLRIKLRNYNIVNITFNAYHKVKQFDFTQLS